MKIAFLHMTMGITSRGSEVVVDNIAKSLSKNNTVMVIQSGSVEPKSYLVKRVFPLTTALSVAPKNIFQKLLFRLHLDAESGAVANFTMEAKSNLTQFDPDIIVAVNGPLQVRILKRMALKAKIVVFGHAGIGYHDRDNLKSKPNLFVALTPQSFAWAKNIASIFTHVAYIPNPIIVKKYANRKLNLPDPIVLTVSALSKYKNIDKIVDAIKSTSLSWVLIGDGEEREIIENKLSKLANDFRWIRSINQSEIMDYYQSADIFCHIPDSQEAFGMVYLEAMSAGLPIVASDDPIRRSIIGNQGLFVDPHNTEQIASAIMQAAKLGKLDYKNELKPFALNTVVSQLEKEFHELIN